MNRYEPLDPNAQAAQIVKECRARIERAKGLIRLSKKLVANLDKRLEQSDDVSRRTKQRIMDTNRLFESARFRQPSRTVLR
jgi:hypothetical protein